MTMRSVLELVDLHSFASYGVSHTTVLRSRYNPVKLDQFILSWSSVFDVVTNIISLCLRSSFGNPGFSLVLPSSSV